MSRRRLLILSMLVVAILSSLFFYSQHARKKPAAINPDVTSELKRVRELDFAVLESGNEEAQMVALSLRRYTAQNLRESEVFIKKYLDDPRIPVKTAALEAAGAYNWAPLASFDQALYSSDKAVRLAALRGLEKRSDPSRILMVVNFLNKGGLTSEDWLVAQVARYRLMPNPGAKKSVELEILAQIAKFSPARRQQAISEIFSISPDSPELIKIARELLQTPGADDSAGQALQYAASFDREWLRTMVSRFAMRKNQYYQFAMIDFLAADCPKDWAQIAQKIQAQIASTFVIARFEETQLNKKCAGYR